MANSAALHPDSGVLARIKMGLRWRRQRWHRYLFLAFSFRNGLSLAHAYWRGEAHNRAVCWNGVILSHPPGRAGFIETLLEVWHEQIYTGAFYQPAEGDVVIDAGANIGIFAIWVARREPRSRVLAFEPFLENYRLLCQNVELAGTSSINTFRAGLSERSGFAMMDDGGARSLDHKLIPCDGEELVPDGMVRVLSMKDVLLAAGSDAISLFKIDIEGSEYALFASASEAEFMRVRRFAIEYHDNIRKGTLEFIHNCLRPTHSVEIKPAPTGNYGMLYATLRTSTKTMSTR